MCSRAKRFEKIIYLCFFFPFLISPLRFNLQSSFFKVPCLLYHLVNKSNITFASRTNTAADRINIKTIISQRRGLQVMMNFNMRDAWIDMYDPFILPLQSQYSEPAWNNYHDKTLQNETVNTSINSVERVTFKLFSIKVPHLNYSVLVMYSKYLDYSKIILQFTMILIYDMIVIVYCPLFTTKQAIATGIRRSRCACS